MHLALNSSLDLAWLLVLAAGLSGQISFGWKRSLLPAPGLQDCPVAQAVHQAVERQLQLPSPLLGWAIWLCIPPPAARVSGDGLVGCDVPCSCACYGAWEGRSVGSQQSSLGSWRWRPGAVGGATYCCGCVLVGFGGLCGDGRPSKAVVCEPTVGAFASFLGLACASRVEIAFELLLSVDLHMHCVL